MAAKPLSPLPSPASAAKSPPVHSGASGLPPFLINSAELELAHGFPGEGNGTPLQYSGLENPTDGGAWWAAVHGA